MTVKGWNKTRGNALFWVVFFACLLSLPLGGMVVLFYYGQITGVVFIPLAIIASLPLSNELIVLIRGYENAGWF